MTNEYEDVKKGEANEANGAGVSASVSAEQFDFGKGELIDPNDSEFLQDYLSALIGFCSEQKIDVTDANNVFIQDENGETSLNIDDVKDTHNVSILPVRTTKAGVSVISEFIIAMTPKFESVQNAFGGLEFIKQVYDLAIRKKLGDGSRSARTSKTAFGVSRDVMTFLFPPKAQLGGKSEFMDKIAIAVDKLKETFKNRKNDFSKTSVLQALSSEQLAKIAFPYLVKPDGQTIFGAMFQDILKKLESEKAPLVYAQKLYDNRETVVELEEDDEDVNLDELDIQF